MSRREIGCSARGMITGSGIEFALYCATMPIAPVLRRTTATSCARGARALARAGRGRRAAACRSRSCAADLAKARAALQPAPVRRGDRRGDRRAPRSPDTAEMPRRSCSRARISSATASAPIPSDLSAAREALGTVRAASLDERDQLELLLALGESLFLEDDFGAAAEILESGLDARRQRRRSSPKSMLEWWGSAVERQASGLAPEPRRRAFARLVDRMQGELAQIADVGGRQLLDRRRPARRRRVDARVGRGGCRLGARAADRRPRASRSAPTSTSWSLQGVIPDRVRHIAQDQRAAAESQLKADWELVKERWKWKSSKRSQNWRVQNAGC